MNSVSAGVPAVWCIVVLSVLGVIIRPFRWNEAVWAGGGALLLVATGLLPLAEAWRGVAKGLDVYLFLGGMMLLAELARREGLFDWLAGFAVRRARGSAMRLFTLVYLVGTLVTALLSNDATAVVLTPAVYAATRAAGAPPLPFLFVCAFIANAASFLLPISNPANLVVYAGDMPPLAAWLARFGLPSLVAIVATYAGLWLTQRRALAAPIKAHVDAAPLSAAGRLAGIGILATAGVLLAASALGAELGLPTLLAGLATAAAVLATARRNPWPLLRGISWAVMPLVAGLFVLVQALERTGLLDLLAGVLRQAGQSGATVWAAGMATALLTNLVNNLPAGLLAGAAVQAADATPALSGAVLVGIDLGPNISVTGSLATILWLVALRREGLEVSAWAFLRLGLLVTLPALALSLLVLVLLA